MGERYFDQDIAHLKKEIDSFWSPDSHFPLLILLKGPLGAGKTTFVQEFFASFGGGDIRAVQSPTFLKILEYRSPTLGKWVHIDTYRMDNISELHGLGLEFLEDAKVWTVEWPELFLEFLKENPQWLSTLGFREVLTLELKVDPIRGSGGRGENGDEDREGGGDSDNRASVTGGMTWTRNLIKELLGA